MLIVQVFVHVRPDAVDTFLAATLDNARHSVLEPGVVRFDVMQQEMSQRDVLTANRDKRIWALARTRSAALQCSV